MEAKTLHDAKDLDSYKSIDIAVTTDRTNLAWTYKNHKNLSSFAPLQTVVLEIPASQRTADTTFQIEVTEAGDGEEDFTGQVKIPPQKFTFGLSFPDNIQM